MNNLEHPKIVTLPQLLEVLAPLKKAKKKIVFTNGCFDILHPGHVDLLARAKACGDLLILGLNSDASVKRQQKGNDRPINPFEQRAFVLAHLSSIDYVIKFEEDTPLQLITAIVPDILIKGGDWKPEQIVGKDVVLENNGQVLSLPLLSGFSTTNIIKHIRATHP